MTGSTLLFRSTLGALLLGASFALSASDEPPRVTEEGLVLVKDSRFALVYVDPEADLTGYDSVVATKTEVAFKKNWRRDQNRGSAALRVTENDMNRIKERLSDEFDSVFAEVLSADDGWQIVEEAGEHVLLLRPAIVNLDVVAPDTMRSGRSRTYAEQAGEMTLYLEIRDSVTGALIAKGMDRQADRRRGYMQWQSSVANTQAARTILKGWATALREGLDQAVAGDPVQLAE
ncbi:MAG: DUF3313 family protein [Xanthomonadales bacterium]|jgi:hypothetical protein|nr:DUF3313 family protein [Xanthomonadales bacterium]